MKTQKELALQQLLKNKGINSNTIDFFIELLKYFKVSEVITSTSEKLAINFGRSERSIQRYVKTLKEHDLIYVRHYYNNDKPDKPYIEKNEYSKTRVTLRVEKQAEHLANRDVNVHFEAGAF